jgi:hypothetical protein
LEEGDIERAAEEKHRLEEKQRAKRKANEHMGIEHRPLYFKETIDSLTGEKMYVFTGNYWDIRKKMDYSNMPDLY